MNAPVKAKRTEAQNRYDAGVKKILGIVNSTDGRVTLDDLEALSDAVEETRIALKDLNLWESIIKTEKEK